MHLDHARARGLLLSAMLLAATTATAAPLDVKLGLWESTVTTEASGAPPMDLSSLTPEQKARVEAMFRARAAQGPRTHVTKTCLTKEKLAKDPASEPPEPGESCSTKIVSQSRTHWKGKRTCTLNGRKRQFDIDITAVSRERTKGTLKLVFSDASRTMKVNGTLSGKWLGSDCGDVR